MGREVRKVTKDWEHPQDEAGWLIPLRPGYQLAEDVDEFESEVEENGLEVTLEDWGDQPDPADYMPAWRDEEATYYQMYENVSEGTPISPPMPTREELAHWLADNEANPGGGRNAKASYEAWLHTCQTGYCFSMMLIRGVGVVDGVNAAYILSRVKQMKEQMEKENENAR
jgi:hypothetical protein